MTAPAAPIVIALAGPSGSGKTTLARALVERVAADGLVFGLDSYYVDQRNVPEEQINVDVPEALDRTRLVTDLTALTRGLPIQQPIYDYATHARAPIARTVKPSSLVVVEGLYALYWADVRALYTTSAFVMLDHEECLRRRVERDMAERGRSKATITLQYAQKVRPMYDQYIHPTRVHAEIVLDGRLPIATLLDQLTGALPKY